MKKLVSTSLCNELHLLKSNRKHCFSSLRYISAINFNKPSSSGSNPSSSSSYSKFWGSNRKSMSTTAVSTLFHEEAIFSPSNTVTTPTSTTPSSNNSAISSPSSTIIASASSTQTTTTTATTSSIASSSTTPTEKVKKELPPPITITPQAIIRIKEILAGKGGEFVGVKVGVKRRGCNGYSYTMNYATEKDKTSGKYEVVKVQGEKNKHLFVLVDKKAVFFLVGTSMHWEETELSSEFTFNNPNAKGSCGCGESFNV